MTRICLAFGILFFGSTAPASPMGFSKGMSPVVLGCDEGEPLCESAAACGECHRTEVAAWQGSAHASAWNNPTFQQGFAREPKRFCFHCHAPLEKDWGRFVRAKGAASAEGISCQACHVRDGVVMALDDSTWAHPTPPRTDLRAPEFCAECHEFNLVDERRGILRETDFPMQRTYSEWQDYQARGGTETCQDCHMPGGDHRFRGARDLEFFRKALALTAKATEGAAGWRIRLSSQHIGHNLPTGDVFRELTLEAGPEGEPLHPVASFKKAFGNRHDAVSDRYVPVLSEDSALRPLTEKIYGVSLRGPLRVRLSYHWSGSRRDEGALVIYDRVFTP